MPVPTPTDGHRVFERAYNARDLEALLALYEPAAKLVLPEGEVAGHDAIRTALDRFVTIGGMMQMTTTSVVEGDRIAVTGGAWRITSGAGQTLVQGESVEVWRKQPDGSWLAAIDCPFGVV